jgi:uncharacterized protein YoxC
MPVWFSLVLAACAVGVSLALVLAVLSARRTLQRTAAILAVVERELGPLATEARGLTTDARALTQETTHDVRRAGEVIERVGDAAAGLSRVTHGLAGLARAGQLVGLVAGLRRGVDVFVDRLRKNGGNGHG